MFVKICGITSDSALAAAVAAGADAVGFVFAESPRRITPSRAATLCADLPAGIVRIAVMRHPDASAVVEVLDTFAPDWLQTEADDFARIELPPACQALPVYRNGRLPAAFTTGNGAATTLPPRLLFEGALSGTGETADWDEARTLARKTEIVLAGGLDPDNVAGAIRYVRPWGIDVSSGVEASRGVKDPKKIEEFVARVRAVENER
jgi:phosphoribosylanthranilate isomerase